MAKVVASPVYDANPYWKSDILNPLVANKLADGWHDLATHAIDKNIFTFPWFVIPSIPLLEKKKSNIITIYQGDLLIGLFLFCEDQGYAKLPMSFYRTALHPDQFLGTPLVRKGYADQFAAGLCNWISSAPPHIQFLLMTLASADSPIIRALHAKVQASQHSLIEVERFERAAIRPRAHKHCEPENLLRPSRLKSLRRKIKNLEKQGTVTLEQLLKASEVESWLNDFMDMENSGWKKKKASSILSLPQDVAFYKKMIPAALEHGALGFFRLCLDGKPIAYTLDLTCTPEAYCMKCAYDPSYRQYAPGVLMEYEALKHYIGQTDYKLVDSCTDPKNQMLNDIWPDRRTMVTMALSRKGRWYRSSFNTIHFMKLKAKRMLSGAQKLRQN